MHLVLSTLKETSSHCTVGIIEANLGRHSTILHHTIVTVVTSHHSYSSDHIELHVIYYSHQTVLVSGLGMRLLVGM